MKALPAIRQKNLPAAAPLLQVTYFDSTYN